MGHLTQTCRLSQSYSWLGDQRNPDFHPAAWHLLILQVLPQYTFVSTLVKGLMTFSLWRIFIFLVLYTCSSSHSLICFLILRWHQFCWSIAFESTSMTAMAFITCPRPKPTCPGPFLESNGKAGYGHNPPACQKSN